MLLEIRMKYFFGYFLSVSVKLSISSLTQIPVGLIIFFVFRKDRLIGQKKIYVSRVSVTITGATMEQRLYIIH